MMMINSSTSFEANNSDEETKVASIGEPSCTDADTHTDAGDIDLGDNYQNAVECLIQCESIINALQDQLIVKDEYIVEQDELLVEQDEQLAKKDEQIIGLEERIVQMSLEMASLKAFEDKHRSKRRVSIADIDDDEDSIDSNEAVKKSPPTKHASDNRALNHSVKTCSFTSASSSGSSAVDESNASRLSHESFTGRLSQLFQKRSSKRDCKEDCDEDVGEMQHKTSPKTPGKNVTICIQDVSTDPSSQRRPPRRPPNRRRMRNQLSSTRLQSSSRSFLEDSGVVFPASFEEVLSKGCLELQNSLRISLSNIEDEMEQMQMYSENR